jgi:hypothetical protein
MLLVLIAAIICFFIGSFIGPQSQSDIDKGFLGYSGVSGATLRCAGRRRLWKPFCLQLRCPVLYER